MRTNAFFISAYLLTLPACTTLNESLQLGATMGALTGAAAVYSGEQSAGIKPSGEHVLSGAAIGLGLGLITSHVIHQNVASRRATDPDQIDMHFGDLPPNPFIFDNNRKGER